MCFYNRIKLCLCMILCDRNPAFDGFNPLQGARNFEVCVWSVWACWCICSLSKAAVWWMRVCFEHWAIPYSISIYGAALMLLAGLWLLELWAGGLSLLSLQELAGVGRVAEPKHGLFILPCLCVRPSEKTWKQKESEWVLKNLNFAAFHKRMLCRHKDHRLGSRQPGQRFQKRKF